MRAASTRIAPTPGLAMAVVLAGLPLLWPQWHWLGRALNLLLLVAAAADLLSSRRRIKAERVSNPVLSLGAENTLSLQLRSPGPPLALELKDTLPPTLELVGAWPQVRADSQWQTVTYRVRPQRRGQYTLGPLQIRYRSPLGLWRQMVTLALPESVRVYPDLLALRQWELAIRQGRHLEGLKRANLRGTGTEFESLRDYQDGDPYRAINWTATARRGRLVTALYQIDRSQPIMLLLDAGRLMLPRVRGLTRLDHALNAALLLATVAAERGDHCGFMLFGGEVRAFTPPRKGRGQVLAMAEALYDVEPEQVEPDYGRMIGWLRARHKKRSLVVLFTDLIDPDISRGLVSHLSALAAHHAVLLVCLSDPALLRLARQVPADSDAAYTQAAALEVLAQRAQTRADLQSRGIGVVDVPPEDFSAGVVNQYLRLKAQGRI